MNVSPNRSADFGVENKNQPQLNRNATLQAAANEKPLPLLLLPNEVLANLCTFLPLKALGQLGQINKRFSDFLGSGTVRGQLTWKLIANKMGVSLISPSDKSYKEQIKNLVIELPEGKVNLLNKKLEMKVFNGNAYALIKEIFTKHVPDDYYLMYSTRRGAFQVFYREGDKVKELRTPETRELDIWQPGVYELYQSVTKTNKCFRAEFQ